MANYTAMNYKKDSRYHEQMEQLLRLVKNMEDLLEEKAAQLEEGTEEEQEKIATKAKKYWENIQKRYHDLMEYLKKEFDIDQDQIAAHRIKQLAHEANELGLDVKLKMKKVVQE